MEPFVYDTTKQRKGNRRGLVAAIAGIALCVWYFELLPQISPAPTGTVDETASAVDADSEFAELLKSTDPPIPIDQAETSDGLIVFGDFSEPDESKAEDKSKQNPPVPVLDDPLMAAIAAQNDVSLSHEPASTAVDLQPVSFASERANSVQRPASPQILDTKLAESLRQIDQQISANQMLEAHAAMSRLYWQQPPSRAHLAKRLQKTALEIYVRPSRHFAPKYTVQFGDTLKQIAQRHKVPWTYLARLNRVTPEQLQAGSELKVLEGPFQAIVETKSLRLTVHIHGWYVNHYSIKLQDEHGIPSGDCMITKRMGDHTAISGHAFLLNDAVQLSGESITTASLPAIILEDRHMADIFAMLSPESVVEIR